MSAHRLLRFRPLTFLSSTAAIAAVLLVVVLVPQAISRQARLDVLRGHVGEAARLVASQVDGDLHRKLIEGSSVDETMRRRALAPLLRLHASWPEAVYVYTMGVRAGQTVFILDTAQDPDFARERGLRASSYLEPFVLREEYNGNWLNELAAGRTYVTENFQYDDYGYFLSGHAPVRDSSGKVAGFVGIDFDLDYYLGSERRFRQIEIASALGALVLALLLGYLYARLRHAQEAELQQHYESSMQDALTGLPNRRGALAAIATVWSRSAGSTHAALLVDIDNFKSINDTHGHAVGDEVIRALASTLRDCVRPGDIAARLGGDEFLLFARNCDPRGAELIAARLLAAVRAAGNAPVGFRVSAGISVVAAADGRFDELYRQADSALYRAKAGGRDRYAVFASD